MDATWPSSEPDVGGNTSVRRLGDILNYGKLFMISKVGVPSTFIEIGLNHVANTLIIYQTFGDPTLEMWTASPHSLVMPATLEYDLNGGRTIDISYGAPGAKLTAFQDVDGELMPLGRVMVDARGVATMDTFGFDPQRPIVFAACRDDAVCVAPTGRRRVGASPGAPAGVVAAAAAGRVSAAAPLSGRRVAAIPSAVDHVLSQTDADTSQAARSFRVLRASRRALGEPLGGVGSSLTLRVGITD
jgi:hypothetical protein